MGDYFDPNSFSMSTADLVLIDSFADSPTNYIDGSSNAEMDTLVSQAEVWESEGAKTIVGQDLKKYVVDGNNDLSEVTVHRIYPKRY